MRGSFENWKLGLPQTVWCRLGWHDWSNWLPDHGSNAHHYKVCLGCYYVKYDPPLQPPPEKELS